MTVGFFGAKGDSWIRMVFLVLSFLSAIGGPHLIESKRVKGKKFWEIVASILEIFEVAEMEYPWSDGPCGCGCSGAIKDNFRKQ